MTMNQARHPEGVPIGGQFAATAHSPGSDLDTRAQRHAQVIAALEATVEARKARRGALLDRLRALDEEDALLGAVKAAVAVRKAYPAARSLDFTRLNAGVALWEEVRDREGLPLASKGRHLYQNLPPEEELDAAEGFLRNVPVEDHDAQGITAIGGLKYRLDLDTALDRAAERLLPDSAAAAEARSADAMAIWDEGEGPEKTMRNMFTDMNHAATSRGIDPRAVFEDSYQMFLAEIYAKKD